MRPAEFERVKVDDLVVFGSDRNGFRVGLVTWKSETGVQVSVLLKYAAVGPEHSIPLTLWSATGRDVFVEPGRVAAVLAQDEPSRELYPDPAWLD